MKHFTVSKIFLRNLAQITLIAYLRMNWYVQNDTRFVNSLVRFREMAHFITFNYWEDQGHSFVALSRTAGSK